MNPEQESIEEPGINEAVGSLMQELPKPVQDFLKSDERDAVARELSAKYQLHVDQAGEFERSFILMLLGVMRPEEFVTTLTQAGLSQDIVNGLAADLNTRVFMKLRDAEREQVAAVPPTPQKPAPLPPPALDYQPAATPTLPGSPVPAPMPPPVATQAPVVLEPTPAPSPVPQQHFVHAMPGAHAQAGWHPAAAVHIFVPTQPNHHPQPAPVQAVPNTEPAPEVEPVTARIETPPAIVREPEIVPPQPTPPSTPLKKEFSSDPYREPIQ